MPNCWLTFSLALTLALPCVGVSWGQFAYTDSARVYGGGLPTQMQAPSLPGQQIQANLGDTYVVHYGDTLWGVARKTGVSYRDLKAVNGLAGANPQIYEGQRLRLPAARVPTRARTTAAVDRIHVVQTNETLTVIARRYGVTVRDIVVANNLANPNSLSRGLKLVIPGGRTTARDLGGFRRPANPGPAPRPNAQPTRPNPWPPKAIPAAGGYVDYVVKGGDSTQSIARAHRISTQELLRINRIHNPGHQPREGEHMLVPNIPASPAPSPSSAPAPAPTPAPRQAPNAGPRGGNTNPWAGGARLAAPPVAPAAGYTIIRIAPGDSLESLAQRYGTTVEQIKLDNRPIRSNADLRFGEELRIRTPGR